MKYLFIAGCARSGTSALAQLVGSHRKIVMGMERFGHLVAKSHFSLTPGHFERSRFLAIEADDTFYSDFDAFHSWDPHIREKFDGAVYIGDKRPGLCAVYDELFSAFPGATVIFIYRNVCDVAASWNKRAEDGENWPASLDFQKAVHAWNQSMSATAAALAEGMNILPVSYEEIFISGQSPGPLFTRLGLEFDETARAMYRNQLQNSARLIELREAFRLSDEQRSFVNEAASFRYLKTLDAARLKV